MESLARLVIILFMLHFIAGLCTGGACLLLTSHFNFWVKNVIFALTPILAAYGVIFPLNVSFVVGYLIPVGIYWISLLGCF